MILGISTSAFTLLHVVVSLIAIVTGIIVAVTMLGSKTTNGWTAIFLATTALTSITGFLFPRDQVLPSQIVGAVSLLVLIIAIAALYGYRLARSWRWIYVVSALVALYLNVFVLVAQAFQKVAILNALAPTQSDPGFIVAQLIVVSLFTFGSIAEGLLVEAHESDLALANEVTQARIAESLRLGAETYQGELEMDFLSKLSPIR